MVEMKLLLIIAYLEAAQASQQISVADWAHANLTFNEVLTVVESADNRKEIAEVYPENIVGDYFF